MRQVCLLDERSTEIRKELLHKVQQLLVQRDRW